MLTSGVTGPRAETDRRWHLVERAVPGLNSMAMIVPSCDACSRSVLALAQQPSLADASRARAAITYMPLGSPAEPPTHARLPWSVCSMHGRLTGWPSAAGAQQWRSPWPQRRHGSLDGAELAHWFKLPSLPAMRARLGTASSLLSSTAPCASSKLCSAPDVRRRKQHQQAATVDDTDVQQRPSSCLCDAWSR